jgi:ribonucleoside-diphosphate reductase alpha chain
MVAQYPQLAQTRLAQLVDMDIYTDTIDQIEDAMTHTFDISVPETHTYIANGFVSHNTTGTMVNTSTGIEPFFSWVYYRKSRLGLHEERMPIAQEYFDANPDTSALPDYFVTAMELSPEEHVRAQGAFQRWVDSAISKTCNVPKYYTVEQVSELYKLMYETGCKGGTIYRDGSRDEQVLMLKGDERAEKEMAEKDGKKADAPKAEAKPEPAAKPAVATPHRVYPRPKKLQGVTVTTATPFGTAYVTMNLDEHGMPFEVFITAPGKAGSDLQADAEGLGRLVSLSLRTTEPHNRRQMLKLIVEQLRDIGGSRTAGFGPNRVTSLPDAVARALEEHFLTEITPAQLSLPLVGDPVAESPKPVAAPKGSNGNGNGNGNGAHGLTIEASAGAYAGADMCPECHTISLVRVEGCRKCLTCGYSEC